MPRIANDAEKLAASRQCQDAFGGYSPVAAFF
jgi:hypothetical protein